MKPTSACSNKKFCNCNLQLELKIFEKPNYTLICKLIRYERLHLKNQEVLGFFVHKHLYFAILVYIFRITIKNDFFSVWVWRVRDFGDKAYNN